ncbi:MAG TPA: hypothetical protein VFC46_15400, partial [Humisphaera sp.]|nr:hypothetical protein [Humisphaera sp.]
EADARPEDKLEAKAVRGAVATADALSTEGVVKSIGELRSSIGKTLAQLSDRLEEEVSKYVQIQRAIVAKEAELKEIYDIQKNASTLTYSRNTFGEPLESGIVCKIADGLRRHPTSGGSHGTCSTLACQRLSVLSYQRRLHAWRMPGDQ